MKTIKIALFTLFTLVGVMGMAQKTDRTAERLAKTDSILIVKLELTDAEQKAFLPIYHQQITDKKALRKKFRPEKGKGKKKMDELNDAEMEAMIQKRFEFTQADLNLKKSYHEKYKKVLPMKKLAKFYHIEKRIQSRGKGKNKGRKGGKGKK